VGSLESDKKKALGRGLASLIPDAAAAATSEGVPMLTQKKEFFLCDIEKIVPNTYQPRKIFSKEALDELVESVKAVGVIQPITVRQKDGCYEIIAGERRWRAAQRAGLKQVPVVVKDLVDDGKALQMAIIENIQREDLNCVEEAIAYQQLMDEFDLSQEEIALRVGKNRATVANTVRLLKLPSVVREDLTSGKLTMGHARALLGLESTEDQLLVRELILRKKLSVRDTERKVTDVMRQKSRPAAAPGVPDANLVALEDSMRRKYGVPVKIVGSESRGSVHFSYSSAAELMRLVDLLTGESAAMPPAILEDVLVEELAEALPELAPSAVAPMEVGTDVSPPG